MRVSFNAELKSDMAIYFREHRSYYRIRSYDIHALWKRVSFHDIKKSALLICRRDRLCYIGLNIARTY